MFENFWNRQHGDIHWIKRFSNITRKNYSYSSCPKKVFFLGVHIIPIFTTQRSRKHWFQTFYYFPEFFSLSPVEWHFLTSAMALNRLENWIETDNSLQRRPCRLVFCEMGNVYKIHPFKLSWKFAKYTQLEGKENGMCVKSWSSWRNTVYVYVRVFLLTFQQHAAVAIKLTESVPATMSWLLLYIYPRHFKGKHSKVI